MHQTTCGETHKIEIFDKSNVSRFLKEEKETFDKYQKNTACLYSNKKIVNSSSINYLNEFFSKQVYEPDYQLKSILKKEFDECEKLYPYLGEVFLNLFFNIEVLKNKKMHVFKKETADSFISSSKDKNAKNIVSWIKDNSSFDRVIDVCPSFTDTITLKKEDDIFFKLEYDTSFMGSKKSVEMKNYRFAIIDGFIESVSEIHHMLHFAAKNKEPHVLFCFGMSEEVKQVILQNNSKGITQIFPVSMTINEDTINILSDIALLHKSEVISSLKGQTISQEMRKELKVGEMISFTRDGFKIHPLCEKQSIDSHIRFLKKRIDESPPDSNTDLIKKRIKNLNSKVLKVFIPERLKEDVTFNREIDYLLRMTTNAKMCYYIVQIDSREVYIPSIVYKYGMKKVNTTKNMFYNIDKILIRKEPTWVTRQK